MKLEKAFFVAVIVILGVVVFTGNTSGSERSSASLPKHTNVLDLRPFKRQLTSLRNSDEQKEKRATRLLSMPFLFSRGLATLGQLVRGAVGNLKMPVQLEGPASGIRDVLQGKTGAAARFLLRDVLLKVLWKQTQDDVHSKIFGGSDAVPEQLPWQISVQFYGVVHFCGGTILRKNIALTAGHCIEGFQAWELAAVAGITDRSSSASSMQVRRVERMEAHPKYNPVNALNDLGIILLETDFDFNSFVQHIPLPKETTIVKPDSDCIVSGWGSTDPYGIEDASRLQYAKLKIVPDSRCQERLTVFRRVYGQSFSKDLHLCAAVESGLANACFGDSGGPFVCPTRRNATFLAGVVSWGPEVCGSSVIPVVFTDVRAYLPWIVRTVADLHQAQQRMMNST